MSEIVAVIGKIFLIVGLAFDLLGCIGLVRLPDVYNRLQASTVFIVMSSPTGAHAIAHAAHRSGIKLWEKSVVDKLKEDKK